MDNNFHEKKMQHWFCYPSIPMQKCYFHSPKFRLLSKAIEFLHIFLASFIHFSSFHLIFIDHWHIGHLVKNIKAHQRRKTMKKSTDIVVVNSDRSKDWWLTKRRHIQTTLLSVGKALKKQHCLRWVLHNMFIIVNMLGGANGEKKSKAHSTGNSQYNKCNRDLRNVPCSSLSMA